MFCGGLGKLAKCSGIYIMLNNFSMNVTSTLRVESFFQ